MKLKSIMSQCQFIIGATSIKSLPDFSIPEVALAGRSNVGKSSLINAITNNRKNARISSKPGCTRQINFYLINKGLMVLVDLPGYGYSKADRATVNSYICLMEYYLLNRKNLSKVVLLIDAKVGFKEIDLDFIRWLEVHQILYQLVLTKIDRVQSNVLDVIVSDIQNFNLNFIIYPIINVSSKCKQGIEELIYEIAQCIKK
ncbi:YihA family ribosome biogenesis GTP-binding protein [Ehrlichia ruminantium]|uniref:Probable GTP-binding protein EngB n=1 Tax=Ehrlichia ruminantium (strain Welgevonden) TaxID=254945 RepID=ENGB_EHRRW|nr:ribosome biogenesis GTP-binding protein YihA/YsxC [Ehrlichia ruminantium]Q5HB81.1 RecName: Full=Probable GTP-binding protein EngB [Ehrlichia ruminantium str. Welgevonden]KYW90249.1 GTP-binding protein [Ehrlichia ruminantium]QLK50526.1 YihA family ribosome biogenesis GTP-binding protein [Ehrlichia ruminantium]QLK51451.1 YihA family ribosome biogenesis GTP-binding protein [Ehrlichia ruminantium]QLK55126.1 YihA family ribosome biogenesis GTP-binding protein [Ehrlichia ruminantium]QLK56043.1 Y